ncbi:MAG: hypothetical protein DCC67_05860 [Planctomycetota bacterium]|nr:MAG: hypothetical protein DCC67_05860 [Planctomycetota bacterium]
MAPIQLKLAAATLGALAALSATRGGAIVIDDFSVGQIVVADNLPVDQLGLDPNHVLGGSRRIAIGQYGSGSRLEVTDDGRLMLSSTGWGYHTITYGAAAPLDGVDLTAEGHDRLRLTFGEIGGGFHPLRVYVNLPTNSSSNAVSLYVQDAWDGLILEYPYSSFPVSFSSVQRIALDSFRNPGTAYAIDSLVTAGPSAAGDFNRDGTVDVADFETWQRFFGLAIGGGSYRPVFAAADATKDGRIDGVDFLAWQRSLPLEAPATSPVPEPAGAAIVLAGAALALIAGRRRGSGES